MAAVVPTKTSQTDQQVKPEKVFGTQEFELLVSRVVRKHITQQYCNPQHPVLKKEEELLAESRSKVLAHLHSTEAEWKDLPYRLRKITVIRHLRELAKARLHDHVETQDLDEDIAATARDTIMALDFEELFPKTWVDG